MLYDEADAEDGGPVRLPISAGRIRLSICSSLGFR